MSIDPATKLEFDLGPGITLRIGKSRITIRFQFPKGTFTDYLATNNKNIPKLDLIYEIVSGTEHGIAMPDGLLPQLIAHLEQALAACAKPGAPKP